MTDVKIQELSSKLAEVLKNIRLEKGLTMTEVAAASNGYVSDRTVSNVENASVSSALDTLFYHADALGYRLKISLVEKPDLSKLKKIEV